MLRSHSRPFRLAAPTLAALAGICLVLASCADGVSGPVPGNRAIAAVRSAETSGADELATMHWNTIARSLIAKYRTDPAARTFAALSLAQFAAANTTLGVQHGTGSATRAAVAGASVTVLGYLYPAEVAMLEAEARSLESAEREQFAKGVKEADAVGRAAAGSVIDRLRTDRSDALWTGSVPTGAGLWVPRGAPVTPLLGQVQPYFLESGSQLRPPAPPLFGSTEFQAALAEVRALSDARTDAQRQLAQRWSYSGGTIRMPGFWNETAAELIGADGTMSEREAAIVMTLLNAAMMDATIACFDAKYVYWYIRPSQADPAITLGTSLSNHPSYPSSHSCTSGAGAEVLATLFPADAPRLRALEAEIGESRIIGGLHYRFDVDVGAAMGEAAGRIALDAGRKGVVELAGR